MEVMGAVVVFLLGAAVGMLVALYLLATRFARSVEAQLAEADERDEQRADERRAHLDATAAIVVDRMWLVGAGLAAEIREMAAAQRNDLRLVVGLPTVEVPGARASRHPPHAPSTRIVGDDEPTPPSGWTLEEVRERTHHDAERSR
jgi:hypothetical protein